MNLKAVYAAVTAEVAILIIGTLKVNTLLNIQAYIRTHIAWLFIAIVCLYLAIILVDLYKSFKTNVGSIKNRMKTEHEGWKAQ